jgi:hypothetical protein
MVQLELGNLGKCSNNMSNMHMKIEKLDGMQYWEDP